MNSDNSSIVSMNTMNRLANVANRFQGEAPRVLCVCSAGLLRSPTTAMVLSKDPFNFNTRSVGAVPEFALLPLDIVLVAWADAILTMEKAHTEAVEYLIEKQGHLLKRNPPIFQLGIPDYFEFANPSLVRMIEEKVLPLSHKIQQLAEENHQ